MPERRIRLITFAASKLPRFFVAGIHAYAVIKEALPDDSRIVDAQYDASYGVLKIIVESQEFEPVEEGAKVTEITPVFLDRIDLLKIQYSEN